MQGQGTGQPEGEGRLSPDPRPVELPDAFAGGGVWSPPGSLEAPLAHAAASAKAPASPNLKSSEWHSAPALRSFGMWSIVMWLLVAPIFHSAVAELGLSVTLDANTSPVPDRAVIVTESGSASAGTSAE